MGHSAAKVLPSFNCLLECFTKQILKMGKRKLVSIKNKGRSMEHVWAIKTLENLLPDTIIVVVVVTNTDTPYSPNV